MTITHIILFKFKEDVDPTTRKDVLQNVLVLKDNCLDATSQKPYILKLTGGLANSVRGLEGGITHVFVIEFANEADLRYYLEEDPVHRKFSLNVRPLAEKFMVVDYTPGIF